MEQVNDKGRQERWKKMKERDRKDERREEKNNWREIRKEERKKSHMKIEGEKKGNKQDKEWVEQLYFWNKYGPRLIIFYLFKIIITSWVILFFSELSFTPLN